MKKYIYLILLFSPLFVFAQTLTIEGNMVNFTTPKNGNWILDKSNIYFTLNETPIYTSFSAYTNDGKLIWSGDLDKLTITGVTGSKLDFIKSAVTLAASSSPPIPQPLEVYDAKNDALLNDLINLSPIGYATTAKQDVGNTSLSNIESKIVDLSKTADITALQVVIAKESKQDAANTSLVNIDTKLTNQSTAANQVITNTKLNDLNTTIAAQTNTQSTFAKQDIGNTSLASIDTKLTNQSTAANQVITNTKLDAINTAISTQSTAQSTAAKQDVGNTSLSSIDGKLTNLSKTADVTALQSVVAKESKQDVSNTSLASIDGKLTNQSTASNQLATNTKLDAINTAISTQSTAQATATKQDVGNTSLASIDSKLTNQSTAANQVATNTKLDAINTSITTQSTTQATAAKQDVGNTSLASIDTKLTPASPTVGGNATLVNQYAATTTIVTTGARRIYVENVGTVSTTVTYGGVIYPLEVYSARTFYSEYDDKAQKYSPLAALVVNATATARINVCIIKYQ